MNFISNLFNCLGLVDSNVQGYQQQFAYNRDHKAIENDYTLKSNIIIHQAFNQFVRYIQDESKNKAALGQELKVQVTNDFVV